MKQRLELPGRKRPYIMAHRGNRVLCPENTLAAFKQAFKDGADIIETDLHLSKDDEYICIHDDTLDRTTDKVGAIAALTVAEIKEASANNQMHGFEKERVPLLHEVTAILPPDVALALELKSDRFLEMETCERLIRMLDEVRVLNRTIFLSFSMERLQTIKQVQKDLPIGWITMRELKPPKDVEMVGVSYPLLWANPLYVSIAHRRGILVCPLDLEPEKRLKSYLRRGCDAVITDNSATTMRKLMRLGAR